MTSGANQREQRDIYREVKQCTPLNSVWEAAAQKVGRQQIKKLPDSMNGRLISLKRWVASLVTDIWTF